MSLESKTLCDAELKTQNLDNVRLDGCSNPTPIPYPASGEGRLLPFPSLAGEGPGIGVKCDIGEEPVMRI